MGETAIFTPGLQCCLLCGRTLTDRALHDELEGRVLDAIRAEHPEWVGEGGACAPCTKHYRGILKSRASRAQQLKTLARRGRLWRRAFAPAAAEVEFDMKKIKYTLIIITLLFAGVVLAGCSTDAGGESPPAVARAAPKGGVAPAARVGTAVGDAAPDFQLTKMDGSAVTLGDLRGEPAVLVFWTAWCPACKEEALHVNELAAKYGPRGVRVLGVNIMDSTARAEGGIKEFGIRYPVARDPDASVTRRYRVAGTPTIIFLDRGGVVRYFGNALPSDYAARLDAMIAGRG